MSSKQGGIHFFKTTVIGGLVFLVPVVVLVIILAKAADLMMVIAEPMAAYMESIERFGQGTNEVLRTLVHSHNPKGG